MPGPAISVVMATYNRSRALACAIESVLRQTFTDWELIVVGDGCTDDTGEVVERYVRADPRIRFVNLERNWGEQSAPNNVGRSLARAPLIAYLSHDDLWLPHHLKACSEALAVTGADLVLGTAANILFENDRLEFDSLHVLLQGLGEGHCWSPSELDASFTAASCWVIRTEALDRAGGWRMSYKERAEPSQGLLFRVWRRGFRIHTLNDLSLVIVTAGTRPKSYLERETPIQDWLLKQLDNPLFPAELAARAWSTNASAATRTPRRPALWRRTLAGILAGIGINPRDVVMAMRHGWKRGAYLRYLRRHLSLGPTGPATADEAVRAGAVRRVCRVAIGTPVDFRAGAGGACYLASGWSQPEPDGVWSDGPVASLMFDIGVPPSTDLRLEFSVVVFQIPQRAARQVIIQTNCGQAIDNWKLPAPEMECSVIIPVSAWSGSRIGLCFRFDDPISPKELGLSEDSRQLSLKLRRLCFHASGVRPTTSAVS